MKNGIRAAVRLERALRASRKGFVAGSRKQTAEGIPAENTSVGVAVNIPETERRVLHFGKHARFIARVHVAVIVVHEHTHTSPRGRLQINVSGGVGVRILVRMIFA